MYTLNAHKIQTEKYVLPKEPYILECTVFSSDRSLFWENTGYMYTLNAHKIQKEKYILAKEPYILEYTVYSSDRSLFWENTGPDLDVSYLVDIDRDAGRM